MNCDKKIYKLALKELEHFESNLGYAKTKNEAGTNNKTLSALKKCFQLMANQGKVKLSIDKKYDLKDLFIEGFDQEQIWQQIELRNRHFKSYVPVLTDFLLNKHEVHFPCLNEKEEVILTENNSEENIEVEEQEEDSDDELSSMENGDLPDTALLENDSEQENVTSKEKKKSKKSKSGQRPSSKHSSVVDDEFFKLSDMEKFLDRAEKEEAGDNEIDYFEDIPSDSDSSVKNAKYNDFFSNPDSEDENMSQGSELEEGDGNVSNGEMDEDEEPDENASEGDLGSNELKVNKNKSKKVKFSMTGLGSSEESDGEEKTAFEIRESKLKEKIKKMEEKNLSEKPWKYKGEVEISDRPVNSLLEEVLDVDLSTRPPPIITEAVTDTLEQIIKNRIKDSAYDDVERKIKPVHIPHELKKELVLNQEKSKYSLAEVYEQEFLKRKPAEESTEEHKKPDPEKEKILKKMKSVFHKLNTLSNFHYTPKPASAEIEIVSNMPAIAIEEVTPAAISDANLLAPQEVGDVAKKKLLGKDERTKTDKLRERRKKKAFLSRKFKKANNTKDAMISNVLKSRSVDLIKPTQDSSLKSSTSFFNKLQENSEAGKFVKTAKKKKK